MSFLIENKSPENNFAMVPRALISDASLSHGARMLLILMCSKPPGYITNRSRICAEMGIGDNSTVWRRLSKELRERGAMAVVEHRCEKTGKLLGSITKVSWEQWISAERCEINPPVATRRVEKQPAGTRNQPDLDLKSTRLNERETRARSRLASEAPRPRREEGKKSAQLEKRRRQARELGLPVIEPLE